MPASQIKSIGILLLAGVLLSELASQGKAGDEPAEKFDKKIDPAAAQLEAIGGLSAINAQHTFLLIGVVSDAHIRGIYEPKQVRSMMNGVIRQLETLNGMLRKLQKGKLSEEDDEYVERVLALHLKLQAQARALNSFVDKKGDAEARVFEKSRQLSLRELERLLGVENGKPAAPAEGVETGAAPADGTEDEQSPDKKPVQK